MQEFTAKWMTVYNEEWLREVLRGVNLCSYTNQHQNTLYMTYTLDGEAPDRASEFRRSLNGTHNSVSDVMGEDHLRKITVERLNVC